MTIFKAFANRTILPVQIDEIKKWIIDGGFAHQIHYYPMDRSPDVVAALVRVSKYKPPYAVDDVVVADIPFSTQLPETEQRIAAAKELVHILDSDEYVAGSYEKVSELVDEVVIPLNLMAEMAKIPGMGMFDHTGILSGLAVLVPHAALEILTALHAKGVIGTKEVAALANIPEEYAEFILSEAWRKALAQICK